MTAVQQCGHTGTEKVSRVSPDTCWRFVTQMAAWWAAATWVVKGDKGASALGEKEEYWQTAQCLRWEMEYELEAGCCIGKLAVFTHEHRKTPQRWTLPTIFLFKPWQLKFFQLCRQWLQPAYHLRKSQCVFRYILCTIYLHRKTELSPYLRR